MKSLFECSEDGFYTVPDGTLVNPYLNPKDIKSGLPWDLLDGLSVAAGQVDSGIVSDIIVHSFISHVIVLLSGEIKIWMKEPWDEQELYAQELKLPEPSGKPGFTSAALLIQPGTFLQLDNSQGSEPARLLYLSNPSYIFEPGETKDSPPVYDDAMTLGKDWERLEAQKWNPPELHDPSRSYAARQRAIQRLAAKSREGRE
ncbi:hypothetical protein [Rubellicoccus peritrichatus]|uniref:Cupin n=1 Tax=Rubellicoccus peritrichatus TaxID=3080537 RepID=A0AAQ3LFJ5_9BACT|nr:hypothetical protein [Puniceicoccus sp. CR14]WOO41104.1 hypothetical protein RZN69_20990 [Puniceicoccus sp. CR14]